MAFFIPHNGCPERCSFCDQNRISGAQHQPLPEEIAADLTRAAAQLGARVRNAEIAFFGGSFTAIDPGYMRALLEAAQDAVKRYGFAGIRCSTRPDAVSDAVLDVLVRYGVTAVELGAQSMCDAVLLQNRRGHTAQDVRDAAGRLHARGFALGLQMMTGLPSSTPARDAETMRDLLALSPATMRIYPTVVLENTMLCRWYEAGDYVPQTLEAAVSLCAALLQMAEAAGVRVIRVGLHASEALERRVAGPYHPAFRELCESRIFLESLTQALGQSGYRKAVVEVAERYLSAALGQRRTNIESLAQAGFQVQIQPAKDLSGRQYRIKDGTECF